jgi:dihydroorotase
MEKHGMPLLIHGEVTDSETDIFDREKVFIERHLVPLRERFPALRIVLEHITTRDAVDYISACPDNVAATITPQHLLLNRNALLVGGIRPHNYCLPVLKRETHRQALVAAATGESGKFFLGSDTAPHNRAAKESACGCAGIYSAHASLELYTEVFDQAGALDRLNAFASERGAAFYRLPVNTETVTLVRESWTVPDYYDYEGEMLVPFRAGQQIHWRLQQ